MGNRGTHTFPGTSRSQPFDFQSVGQGLFSQRPPAGFPGRLFYATDNGILYQDSGLAWNSLQPRMVTHSETTVTFNTSTAENDLMNFSLSSGTLAAGDALRIHAFGDILHSGVAADAHQFRFRFGSSLMFDTGASDPALANSATRKSWAVDIILQATSLSTQRGRALLSLMYTGTAVGTVSWLSSSTGGSGPFIGSSTAGAESLAAAVTTRLTVQHTTSNANIETRLFGYTVEKLTA